MDLGLSGKKALITGSTKGLGRAIAETLVAEGASVAICSRTQDDVDAAVAAMSEGASGTVVGSVCDAGDPDAVRAWVAESSAALGGIDIYVHNTSGKPAKSFDAWQNNMNIDLMSLIHGADAAGEALADGGGALVSISTTAVNEHFGSGSGSYSAFKAAVTNWTLGQAQVLGSKGVRCNVVSPGPIYVEGGDWNKIKDHMADFYAATQKTHPNGDLGTPQDVANAVAFLVSDAAKHVNGVNLTVDGGFLKRVDY